MSRICDSCGKKTVFGNQLSRRGLAKYKGGVGIKTTGVSRRKFKPNLQKVRAQLRTGAVARIKVCTKCIRSGVVKKPMIREIPEGLRNRMRAAEEARSPEARRRKAKLAGERRRQRKAQQKARASAKAKK